MFDTLRLCKLGRDLKHIIDRHGGVRLQTIRDWMLRFGAKQPNGLLDGKSSEARRRSNADHRSTPARSVEDGPVFYINGMVR